MKIDDNILVRIARILTWTHGHWTMPQLARALESETGIVLRQTLDKRFGAVRNALEDGSLVEFSARSASRYTVKGVLEVNLLDLRRLAESAVDPDKSNKRGRRARHQASRRIESLSKGQFVGIRAIVNTIGAYLKGPAESAEDALRRVDFRYFAWDESARSGEGEWSRFLELARTASEAKHGAGHKNLHNDIGAACLLLDLAASEGWIARSPRHSDAFEAFPAEWAPLHNEWRECLLGAKPGISHPAFAVKELLGACSATDVDPWVADWGLVAEYLEDRWHRNQVASTMRSNVRMAYRELRSVGKITAFFEWPSWMGRRSLVSTAMIQRIGNAYGANTNPETIASSAPPRAGRVATPRGESAAAVKTWNTPESSEWREWMPVAKGLVEGAYGLQRFLEYQCAEAMIAEVLDLPPRGIFPRQMIRPTNQDRAREPWRAGTVITHLTRICGYAGWITKRFGTDFSQDGADLRVLLDEENLLAYRKEVTERQVSTHGSFRLLVITLSRIASPYMECVAVRAGDEALADRMARVGRMLDSPTLTDNRQSWGSSLRPTKQERTDRIRAQAARVEEVFTKNGDTSAYAAFIRVSAALVSLASEAAGGRSLDEQLAAVQRGERLGREWAWLIQAAQYSQDQLVIPLRTRVICLHTVSMRTDVKEVLAGGRAGAKYPAKLMKGDRDFPAEYLTVAANTPGNPVFELWDPRIYALHLLPGGARETLLTGRNGRMKKCEAFYVLDALDSRSKSVRWTPSALTNVRRRIFNCTQSITGLPSAAELAAEGVLGNHSSRHGFGSQFAPHDLVFAAHHLHHADLQTTVDYYCASNASNLGGASKVRALLQKQMRQTQATD